MKKHLRVDGAGDAVIELGIQLGKLVAEKKRIIVEKSEQEIGSAHWQYSIRNIVFIKSR